MAFSDSEINKLCRSTSNDTHNLTLLIRLKYVSDILDTEETFTVEENKHRHTHTRKHTKLHLIYQPQNQQSSTKTA